MKALLWGLNGEAELFDLPDCDRWTEVITDDQDHGIVQGLAPPFPPLSDPLHPAYWPKTRTYRSRDRLRFNEQTIVVFVEVGP